MIINDKILNSVCNKDEFLEKCRIASDQGMDKKYPVSGPICQNSGKIYPYNGGNELPQS